MKKTIDRNWYNSKNVRPKTFTLEVERTSRGGYRVVGANIINEINQYAVNAQRVDARDLISDISAKGGIVVL